MLNVQIAKEIYDTKKTSRKVVRLLFLEFIIPIRTLIYSVFIRADVYAKADVYELIFVRSWSKPRFNSLNASLLFIFYCTFSWLTSEHFQNAAYARMYFLQDNFERWNDRVTVSTALALLDVHSEEKRRFYACNVTRCNVCRIIQYDDPQMSGIRVNAILDPAGFPPNFSTIVVAIVPRASIIPVCNLFALYIRYNINVVAWLCRIVSRYYLVQNVLTSAARQTTQRIGEIHLKNLNVMSTGHFRATSRSYK